MSVGWYFLLAAAGLDLLLPFLLAPFYPGYSHRRQVMSVLGSPESPVRWVYRVWLVALGLLLCAATPDLWAAFGNRSPVLTGLLIAVLCVFALGAGVLAGLFSVNADKAVETAASRIHGVGSVLGFLALAFAPLLVALLAFRDASDTTAWISFPRAASERLFSIFAERIFSNSACTSVLNASIASLFACSALIAALSLRIPISFSEAS